MKKLLEGNWIEIFKGGPQVDSAGKEHDGDAIIDKAVATFNPEFHEPPLTKGHPKDDAPSYGWVEDLKKVTKNGTGYLLAKSKQVVQEFGEMVASGQFKKRSASFYPDGRLRHVGFLGAMPPAVKGLADCSFSDDDDAVTFEFSEAGDFHRQGMGTIARLMRNLRDHIIDNDGKDKADSIISSWEVEHLEDLARRPSTETGLHSDFSETEGGQSTEEVTMTQEGKQFSEADVEQIKKDSIKEGQQKAEASFAEQGKQADLTARKKAAADFVDGKIADGVPLQPLKEKGLVEFMESLENIEGTKINFSEGGEQKKVSPGQFFRDFIETIGSSPLFKDMVKPKDEKTADDVSFSEDMDTADDIVAFVNPAK